MNLSMGLGSLAMQSAIVWKRGLLVEPVLAPFCKAHRMQWHLALKNRQ